MYTYTVWCECMGKTKGKRKKKRAALVIDVVDRTHLCPYVCVCEQLNSINQDMAANRILLLYRAILFRRKETRFLKA